MIILKLKRNVKQAVHLSDQYFGYLHTYDPNTQGKHNKENKCLEFSVKFRLLQIVQVKF